MLRKTLFYCEIIELLTAYSIIARVLNAVGLYLRIEWKRGIKYLPQIPGWSHHYQVYYVPLFKSHFSVQQYGIITISQDSCLSLMNGNYTPGAPHSAIWIITNFFPTCGLLSPHICTFARCYHFMGWENGPKTFKDLHKIAIRKQKARNQTMIF